MTCCKRYTIITLLFHLAARWKSQVHYCGVVSLVNMLDLTWKHFGYGQLWPACSQNPAGLYMLDLTSCIQFGSVLASNLVPFFQRRPRSYRAKLAHIWSGWPGQVLAKCISSESKPVCKNHKAWFWQNAISLLPVSKLCWFLPQTARIILCKTSLDLIWFWLTGSGIDQMDDGSSPEASLCARIIGPASGQCFWANLDQMWIRSGRFTGKMLGIQCVALAWHCTLSSCIQPQWLLLGWPDSSQQAVWCISLQGKQLAGGIKVSFSGLSSLAK